MKVTVEDARPDHIPPMLDTIRQADLNEWYAGTGSADIERGLFHVWYNKGYAKAAVAGDGVALCVWGVDDNGDGSGNIWLFATERAAKFAIAIHRNLRSEMDTMLARWPTLVAFSDRRNTVHHTWLDWIGFEFEREVFLKPFGLPFRKYVRRKS